MGGIKNRDAKRAANKVFSSGGGGSSKGPAKLDKRNQEVKCPHCDKVYKQSSSLQLHIKKQHAEEAADPPQDAATSTPPAAAAESTAAAIPAAAAPKPAPKKEAVMDVGSRAGAYAFKSPKLLLQEWCAKERTPRPRYKALPGSAGRHRARVVIPHPKKSELDRLLVLPDQQAAEDEEEAQQRAAVMGLHAVAGDRALDTLLPPSYRDLWRLLGEQATKHEQKERAAAERFARAQARQKAEAARQARGSAAGKIVMTEEHRRLVSDALGALQLDGGGAEESQDESDSDAPAAVTELTALGFQRPDAARAARALGSEAPVDALLDWLCRHLPESALPKRFAPGAAGKAPEVLLGPGGLRSQRGSRASLLASEESEGGAMEDPAVAQLTGHGYSVPDAVAALERCRGSVRDAHLHLYGLLCERVAGDEARVTERVPGSHEAVEGVDEDALWSEEADALQAIFGEESVATGEEGSGCPFVQYEAAEQENGPRVTLRLSRLPGSGSSAYPHALPLISIRSAELKPAARLRLTAALAALAGGRLGQPMLFELCQAVASGMELEAESLLGPSCAGQALRRLTDPVTAPAQPGGEQTRRRTQARHGAGRAPPPRDRARAQAQSQSLKTAAEQWASSPGSKRMRATRASLPAAGHRAAVLAALASSRVTVIEGATGCGKSTQVPQFILEDAIARGQGGAVDLVCTQPRRISAVGLAARVAAERGERVGEAVGYAVRLDAKRSRETRLLFCTTGILLRRFLSEPDLRSLTHVVVDEVHERSLESDLLLLLLRRLLASGRHPTLRVVLMSATVDAAFFADYFSAATGEATSRVAIPGFTHPVQEYYLEDALELTGGGGGGERGGEERGKEPPPRNGHKPRSKDKSAAKDPPSSQQPPSSSSYSAATLEKLEKLEEGRIDYDLIASVIARVAEGPLREAPPNARAVLVFVSGAEEIDRTVRALRALPPSSRRPALHALPLHGGLSPADQARVFDPAPADRVKVVVATNVAETSITIDDVVCVLDTGRVKEMAYDPAAGLNRLRETWVSRAAAQQRRGRAGRVRPGVCYRLFTRARWEALPRETPPEIHRVALQSLVLDLKGALGPGADVRAAAAAMLSPPRHAALERAVQGLLDIGALERGGSGVESPGNESKPASAGDAPPAKNSDPPDTHAAAHLALTPLGQHLTAMPCDPALGKMLIYGCLLRCLDPILTIAAAMAHGRPIFAAPPAEREQAAQAHRRLTAAVQGSRSDHLNLIAAFSAWRNAGAKPAFCREYFLSLQGLQAIAAGRRQLAGILLGLGFCEADYLRTLDAPKPLTVIDADDEAADARGPERAGAHALDAAAGSARVVKAALTAGLYPNLLRVDAPPPKFQKVHGGTVEVDPEPGALKFFDRTLGRVFLHPASCNFKAGRFPSGWLVYSEVTQTSKVFARATSAVPAYAVLFFAGELHVDHLAGTITAGGWARFKAPARIGVLVHDLRAAMSALLAKKIEDPSLHLDKSPVRKALQSLLVADGT